MKEGPLGNPTPTAREGKGLVSRKKNAHRKDPSTKKRICCWGNAVPTCGGEMHGAGDGSKISKKTCVPGTTRPIQEPGRAER